MSDESSIVVTKNGLDCKCGGEMSRVTNSRPAEFMGFKTVRRRRECTSCGARITTYELGEDALETGRRQAIRAALIRMIDEVI
jgi:transcriptional regulator NrdR family protein